MAAFVLRCILCSALLAAPAIAAPVWIPGWLPDAPLTTPRVGAAVIAVRGVIYAIGGIDGSDFLSSTEYSRIQADQSLAPWRIASPLNEPRGFFAAANFGDYLYVAGGGNGPGGHNLLRSVERVRVLADGGLGAWETEQHTLNLPRRCSKLVVAGRYVYALGGFGGTLLDSIERAEILADGHLGPWRMREDRLTVPRYVSAITTAGDQVFIVGGHDEHGGAGISGVEYATIAAGGDISTWRTAPPLLTGRYGLSATAWRGHVYALGGLAGATYVDAIEQALTSDAGAGAWRVTTPLPMPLANLATVVSGDAIYIIGGTNRDGYYKRVYRASFDAQGDIGYYGSAADARQFEERRQAPSTPARSALPFHGRVLEVVQTGAYTYLRIAGDDGERWLAGPQIDLAVGDHVQFSRGVEMVNFYSRTLQRDFAAIRFVERLEKLP
ncbi:MAG: hypothetical protein FD165_1402 [Gammaproteobacteria bacterium]|nr:MAG: hypothetical protein FD165_1402 [Gammaproteobacteria bacterium]TND04009.1 MAG: hypothetical protein FD120_1718 [Gammaproteobacteria bacterium]